MCGQLFQQNAIDKTKGIIAKPRPKHWFDYGSNKIKDDDSKEQRELKEFNKRLVADKKPYFMQYIYPDVRRIYKKYITDSNKKCQTEFKFTINELKNKPNKTTQEIEFLKYYDYRMPVGTHNCLVNKICWLFENEFDDYLANFKNNNTFDYSILKSSVNYSAYTKNKIEKIYKDYCDKLQKYQQLIKRERINDDDAFEQKNMMLTVFKQECSCICPDQKELANILIDLCYPTNKSKQFVWDMCSSQVIENLLEKNNYIVNYPEKDENGNILYIGEKYSMKQTQIGEV
ncbi:hypothetical protein [Anaerotignum propionicum]|uniref:Uncharacterized protein n=1 Tax=Anaerotignum propionicum DSM 1682 TaxID=991789 RepID=A0A0X8VC87_ANAPI|nr:hypothetical protein [Anaerotignum propionicum]AMJ42345.1 hypothetical protein CPRO_28010 [Anaerotignum propionicum DSM 1682]SHF00062.1 hypothetical protein SAMN02745151_02457 [[Clostridium] propionicum DSM 1682] [Anaerotignum propionicum DSM 1682]